MSISTKEAALSTLQLFPELQKKPKTLKEKIQRIQLYIDAEQPIPTELHDVVKQACVALTDKEIASSETKGDNIYHLIYEIHLSHLFYKRSGVKGSKKRAFNDANNRYFRTDAGDIYKAVGKNYKARKLIAKKAKADAEELFQSQNWDMINEDEL